MVLKISANSPKIKKHYSLVMGCRNVKKTTVKFEFDVVLYGNV
jgi:hypothetical protein